MVMLEQALEQVVVVEVQVTLPQAERGLQVRGITAALEQPVQITRQVAVAEQVLLALPPLVL